ncbi:MAG: NAD(P)H-binding protein [Planctomycetes bacterium]|nr:NAD(P)H-binding protein [Planctomycetota bacterium]
MTKRTYAIMGATGQIGRVVTEKLLERGHDVRALGRETKKLEALRARGAKTTPVRFDDANALAEAFRGTQAVFTMIPPAYDADDYGRFQDRVGEATVAALKKAGTTHVLDLSSIGAHLTEGTGPIKGLHRQEKRLEGLPGLSVLHLRPGWFMENLLWAIPAIREHGVNGSALRGDLSIPLVATTDIGEKAADLLDRLDFRGRSVLEFVGPTPLNSHEATAALGKAIGKPDLRYVQVPYAEAERAMVASGMKPNFAALIVEMDRSLNEGKIEPTQTFTAENRGKTTIEGFAKVFARAYTTA